MPKDVIKSDIYEGRHWWMFVVLSVSLWVLCFVLVLIPRIIVYLCHRPQKRTNGSGKSARTDQVLVEPSFYSSIQNWAEDLISGNTTSGRILVVFAFVCSMVAFLLYLHGKFYFFFTKTRHFQKILLNHEKLLERGSLPTLFRPAIPIILFCKILKKGNLKFQM